MEREQLRAIQAPLKERNREDPDADREQFETLLKLTERYCVVLQTIAGSLRLSATVAPA